MTRRDEERFSITDLAIEFGVTPRTIRFYEDKGLLAPARQGQARVYDRRDRARLKLILRGKRLGFPLDDIREMIEKYSLDDGQEEQAKVILAKVRDRIAALSQQKIDIDEVLGELIEVERQIDCYLSSSERREAGPRKARRAAAAG